MTRFIKNIISIIFIYSFILNSVQAADIAEGASADISTDSNVLQKFTGSNATLTISDGATLERANNPAWINKQSGGTVIVESGSTLSATSANTVQGIDSANLTITNSGTIKAGTSKAINLTDNEGARVTNNAGAIIQSDTNTISLSENSGDTVDNIIITNYGTIFATDNSDTSGHNVIKSSDSVSNITINNEKGGHIYHGTDKAVILLGGDATFNNSGKLENQNDPTSNVITLSGTAGTTLNLKNKGLVIGKIKIDDSNHKINIQHGVGQTYFYETTGNGSYDIADLDGNPIVKGSAGSIGQGSNEMIDEALGHKSLNVRKSLTHFKKSEKYLDQDKIWGELFTSFNKRKEKKDILRLDSKTTSIGANIINPISANKNLIVSVETGSLNFSQGHDTDKFGFLTGIHFNETENSKNINTELFILAGVNYIKSNRKILTNTTTSGELKISDSYENHEFLIGYIINSNSLFPDLSLNFGYSHTPSHKESTYFTWEEKDLYNGSIALSDEYEIIKNEKTNFYLSWIADARTVLDENVQVFHVNGIKGSYSQNSDLKKELSLSTSLNYNYKFSNNNTFSIVLDGFQTSQDIYGMQANLNYNFKF
jgi:hypothetical protein